MTLKFKRPTLVSLTAPTCAGKSFLLEHLVQGLGFQRIVGTTDRAPRAGEIQGIHYDFLTTEQSQEYEDTGKFAEFVMFNGTRYGVTHVEMEKKMVVGMPPPMVILEPTGVSLYRKYCHSKGWDMCTIFVDTPEHVRIERLTLRTAQDLIQALPSISIMSSQEDANERVVKIVRTGNKRLQAILGEERTWRSRNVYDIIVSGEDLQSALNTIRNYVENTK